MAKTTDERPVRIVIAKVGLDGHDRGVRVVAKALQDAGMEVVYLGLRQTAESVAEAALQEDVDAVGISILSAAHMTILPKVLEELRSRELDHVLLTGGGIFPAEDIEELRKMGVGRLFEPGAPMQEFVTYIHEEVAQRRAARQAPQRGASA